MHDVTERERTLFSPEAYEVGVVACSLSRWRSAGCRTTLKAKAEATAVSPRWMPTSSVRSPAKAVARHTSRAPLTNFLLTRLAPQVARVEFQSARIASTCPR